MLLLFSLFFQNCNISNTKHSFYRCTLSKSISTWANSTGESQSTVFYLHKTSKSEVLFDSLNPIKSIKPGEAIKFSDQEVKAHCSGSDCHLTIWYSDYDKDEGFVVADAAGVVYTIKNVTMPQRYVSYFDFGEHSRFMTETISHPRMTGASIYFENETGIFENYLHTDSDSLNFSSPGIFQITKAPFDEIYINVVVGSITQMSSEYSQTESIAPLYTIDKNHQHLPPKAEIDNICLASSQLDIEWVKWATVAATIFVFLLSLGYSIYLFKSGSKKTRVQQNQSTLSVEQPLI